MSNSIFGLPPGILSGHAISMSGSTKKAPEMPESCKEIAINDLLEAVAAIQSSRARYVVNNLNELTEASPTLSDWEVKLVEEAYNRFFVKYKSPLAKALK